MGRADRVNLQDSEVEDHSISVTDQILGLEAQSLLNEVIEVVDSNE